MTKKLHGQRNVKQSIAIGLNIGSGIKIRLLVSGGEILGRVPGLICGIVGVEWRRVLPIAPVVVVSLIDNRLAVLAIPIG